MTDVKSLHAEADNYLQSVLVICALKQHFEYEFPPTKLYPGPKMKIGSKEVTPDMIVLMGKKHEEGVVGEIKLPLPDRSEKSLKECFLKTRSYVDIDVGWPSVHPTETAVFVVTHQSNGPILSEYFERNNTDGQKMAVLSFNFSDQAESYVCIEKRTGTLNSILQSHFKSQNPRSIPTRYVFSIFKDIKFYDADPPVQYTMAKLWDHVFPSFLNQVVARETHGGRKITVISTTKDQIIERLSESCYRQEISNQKKIPRTEWVDAALEKLIDFGLVEKQKNTDIYLIRYHNIPAKGMRGSLDFFISKLAEPQQSKLPKNP